MLVVGPAIEQVAVETFGLLVELTARLAELVAEFVAMIVLDFGFVSNYPYVLIVYCSPYKIQIVQSQITAKGYIINSMRKEKLLSSLHIRLPHLHKLLKTTFWFVMGAILGLFFVISFGFLIFQIIYHDVAYPGISIGNIPVGGKTQAQIAAEFTKKNQTIASSTFTFTSNGQMATISAQALHLGLDGNLLAQQALSVGRSSDIFSNMTLAFQAYINGITLSPSYAYRSEKIATVLKPIQEKVKIDPVNAVFTFENNKVTAFKPSSDGKDIDIQKAQQQVEEKIPYLFASGKPQNFIIPVETKTIHPKITTEAANKLGIKELIGVGTSLFQGSIAGRIYNVELAASRVNNILVAPGDVFSFDQTVGDVSSFTGYKQAYVIQNGKTVLGDGGGVCQVSTTLFRAALNAGLPIVERHAHAYRVEYYEEDGPPGIDATVYVPTVDLKFKNDTGHYMLIQSAVDPATLRLTFYIYGVSDGRKVTMTTPVVTNVVPAPAPLYTDDPTLPTGVVKQTDFAAAGATVTFNRTVTRGDKTLISETYTSNYQPWQAAYLRGTKE